MELTPEMEKGNPHFLAERQLMGDRRIYVHLLISTQLGVYLNDKQCRKERCVVCHASLSHKQGKKSSNVHHLWMRVMGGMDNADKWQYSNSLAPGCHSCKPSRIRRFSLLVLKPDVHYGRVDDFIEQHAFQNKMVDIEFFLGSDSNVFAALVNNYLYRFTTLNFLTRNFCSQVYQLGVGVCFNCKSHNAEWCEGCHALCFCDACSGRKHHSEVCEALRRGRLFHSNPELDTIYYIERSVEGQCVKYVDADEGGSV